MSPRQRFRLCLALATREDERIAAQPRVPVSREAGDGGCCMFEVVIGNPMLTINNGLLTS